MMILLTYNHSFRYELEKLCRIFFPYEKIQVSNEPQTGERVVLTERRAGKTETLLLAEIALDGRRVFKSQMLPNTHPDYEKECERILAVLLLELFSQLTGYTPRWGILTGVRPAKLMGRLVRSMGEAGAEEYFQDSLRVAPEKISLCRLVAEKEEKMIGLSRPDSYSLYIAIPFCPSRCSYCSFVSHSVEKAGRLVPDYVRLLCDELAVTGKIARDLNLRLETVYIGGGTPTSLSGAQLSEIMDAVRDHFDLSHLREYTVEAGRPDTITAERLDSLRQGGVTRISINPQSMNDRVLKAIGRRHTAEQTEEAFRLSRKLGFHNINMDLIAGLPQDTPASFRNTVERLLELAPESITVHTLAVKRAARLNGESDLPESDAGEQAAEMLQIGDRLLRGAGILPYYMYRQSKTVGNLENVGYAKAGFEGFYNVYIMDETHTILACGASGVTKLRQPGENRIERIFNFKYPYEYISRFDEMINRKDRVKNFYEEYGPAAFQSFAD